LVRNYSKQQRQIKEAQKTNAQTEQWQQDEKMGRTIGLSISRIEQCPVYREPSKSRIDAKITSW